MAEPEDNSLLKRLEKVEAALESLQAEQKKDQARLEAAEALGKKVAKMWGVS